MRISVFGLGYVGCVSVACLARRKHQVIGVDVVQGKVDDIAQGKPTVVEPKLNRLLQESCQLGLVSATTDPVSAVENSDISLICVGTPAGPDGCQQLRYIAKTAEEIGNALQNKDGNHLIVVRSTVPPGTVESVIVPAIEAASGRSTDQFSVVIVPEFLREGSAVDDYYSPPLLVVGSHLGQPNGWESKIAELIGATVDQLEWVPYREAELLKSVCNSFHALKVAFANEVGSLCAAMDVDGGDLMRLFCQDTKLNVSAAYLRPGLPFGGSCLPKDLSGVVALAQRTGVRTPLFASIAQSNEEHKKRMFDNVCLNGVCLNGHHRIGLDGLSFKSGTDDLRESPLVELAEHLLGKGYDVRILDSAVDAARLHGANRAYIEQHIPHLAERLVSTAEELIEHSEAVIVTRSTTLLEETARRAGKSPLMIDLSKLEGPVAEFAAAAEPETSWQSRPIMLPLNKVLEKTNHVISETY